MRAHRDEPVVCPDRAEAPAQARIGGAGAARVPGAPEPGGAVFVGRPGLLADHPDPESGADAEDLPPRLGRGFGPRRSTDRARSRRQGRPPSWSRATRRAGSGPSSRSSTGWSRTRTSGSARTPPATSSPRSGRTTRPPRSSPRSSRPRRPRRKPRRPTARPSRKAREETEAVKIQGGRPQGPLGQAPRGRPRGDPSRGQGRQPGPGPLEEHARAPLPGGAGGPDHQADGQAEGPLPGRRRIIGCKSSKD